MEPTGTPTPAEPLTIVVPCYNEAEVIERFCGELVHVLEHAGVAWQVCFVDDGSSDSTLERLNSLANAEPRIRVYSLSRNFGHQIALSAGLTSRLIGGRDDGRRSAAPTRAIPQMIALAQRRRRCPRHREDTEGASWFKVATADAFYWLINRFGETSIVPGAADFCLLSVRAHKAVCAMPERHRFLRGMVAWIGFNRTYVPFQAPRRPAGQSKYTTFKMLSLAIDALFSFSAAPMRMATRLGLALLVPGALYFLYIVVRYVALDDFVRGWGSLIGTLMIIGGIQLIFIGMVGEYLARIFEESKRRPLYFFKQTPDDGGD